MEVSGLLKIQVCRGVDLAIRDIFSSDPYVVIHMGDQKAKTSVKKKNCNPVWNEEFTFPFKDPNVPIILTVFDKDRFSEDDKMGEAEIDVKPYLEAMMMGLQGLPNGVKVDRIQPRRDNCLADESCILWENGKLIQDMILRLKNVECGEIEIKIELIRKGL